MVLCPIHFHFGIYYSGKCLPINECIPCCPTNCVVQLVRREQFLITTNMPATEATKRDTRLDSDTQWAPGLKPSEAWRLFEYT